MGAHERHHLVHWLVITLLILLALGEVVLFRNIQHLNKLTSEGIMQIKEQQKQSVQDAAGALMDEALGE